MSSRPLKIRPLNVDVSASLPPGAELAGHTKQGLPIYRIQRVLAKNEARIDEDGEIVFAKHPTTGEPLYQKRQLVPQGKPGPDGKPTWYVDVYVVPNQQGNGNLSWDDYTPPSAAEIAAAARERKIEEMLPELAGALIDSGLTPAQLAAALAGAPAAAPAAEVAEIPPPAREGTGDPETVDPLTDEAPADQEFPKALPGVGRWELSSGEVFKGTKIDAISREQALKPPEH